MPLSQILALAAVAGFTIYLGLPLGRVRTLGPRVRTSLSAFATGILIFLLWDVLTHAVEPVEQALERASTDGGWDTFTGLAALLGAGFTAGFMGLVHYERWLGSRRASSLVGPGAAAVDEYRARAWQERLEPGHRLALLIATGIGLHNFGEGLAIGQSAATGEITLALVLIIGFGLHNATEGFGIVGPMASQEERPSWRYLGLLGLIGGAPTFLGTLVGQAYVSEALSVAFFAVAAGSILYVVIELLNISRRAMLPILVGWMLVLGLALGFGTDFVLTAAGG